jgi:hypothetical protein
MDVTMHVKGCSECPLRYDGIRCKHPNAEDVDETDSDTPHEFCPLRTGELTLRLERKRAELEADVEHAEAEALRVQYTLLKAAAERAEKDLRTAFNTAGTAYWPGHSYFRERADHLRTELERKP